MSQESGNTVSDAITESCNKQDKGDDAFMRDEVFKKALDMVGLKHCTSSTFAGGGLSLELLAALGFYGTTSVDCDKLQLLQQQIASLQNFITCIYNSTRGASEGSSDQKNTVTITLGGHCTMDCAQGLRIFQKATSVSKVQIELNNKTQGEIKNRLANIVDETIKTIQNVTTEAGAPSSQDNQINQVKTTLENNIKNMNVNDIVSNAINKVVQENSVELTCDNYATFTAGDCNISQETVAKMVASNATQSLLNAAFSNEGLSSLKYSMDMSQTVTEKGIGSLLGSLFGMLIFGAIGAALLYTHFAGGSAGKWIIIIVIVACAIFAFVMLYLWLAGKGPWKQYWKCQKGNDNRLKCILAYDGNYATERDCNSDCKAYCGVETEEKSATDIYGASPNNFTYDVMENGKTTQTCIMPVTFGDVTSTYVRPTKLKTDIPNKSDKNVFKQSCATLYPICKILKPSKDNHSDLLELCSQCNSVSDMYAPIADKQGKCEYYVPKPDGTDVTATEINDKTLRTCFKWNPNDGKIQDNKHFKGTCEYVNDPNSLLNLEKLPDTSDSIYVKNVRTGFPLAKIPDNSSDSTFKYSTTIPIKQYYFCTNANSKDADKNYRLKKSCAEWPGPKYKCTKYSGDDKNPNTCTEITPELNDSNEYIYKNKGGNPITAEKLFNLREECEEYKKEGTSTDKCSE